nr:hypothetical protein [Tanacetum cinerariifolium]
MFEKPQAVEIYDLVDALHSRKQAPGKENLSLNKDFGDFVRNFNMHCVGKTVTELHTLLIDYENGLKDKAPTPQGFKEERKLSYGEQYLQVGNGAQVAIEAI